MSARPPGPGKQGPLELVRFFRAMSSDALGTIGGRFERFGDLYFTVSRGDPLFVTRHPEHARRVLVDEASAYEKRSEDLDRMLGQGLLTANGAAWRRARRLVQPAFARPRLAAYAHVIVEEARRALARWPVGEVRDVAQQMTQLTLSVVTRTLFSHDATPEADRVSRALSTLQDTLLSLDPLPDWVPTPMHRRRDRALATVDAAVFDIVEARRRVGGGGDDLLGALLEAHDEGGALSDRELRDHLLTLYLAGHETTSLALTWTWQLLAAHPEARAEVEGELDGALTDLPALDDLERLPRLRRALDEAMRLYPPAYAIPRRATRKTSLSEYTVDAGAEVIVWVYHLHRDPRWFPEPERFWPDRFVPAPGGGMQGVLHPHAYMPFGAGQRACIGRHFAIFEAQLVLATMMQGARFESVESVPVRAKPRITLGPAQPVPMRRVSRRA